jgi:hypothetical protein
MVTKGTDHGLSHVMMSARRALTMGGEVPGGEALTALHLPMEDGHQAVGLTHPPASPRHVPIPLRVPICSGQTVAPKRCILILGTWP